MSMIANATGYDRYLEFQYRVTGDFFRLLFEALHHADRINTAKLELAFPEEVDALRLWKNEGHKALLDKCTPGHPLIERMRTEYEVEEGG